jgi:ComF family protein
MRLWRSRFRFWPHVRVLWPFARHGRTSSCYPGAGMGGDPCRRSFSFLDVLVPQRCAACGAGEQLVCAGCLVQLQRLHGPLCARCGAPTAWPVGRCAECSGRRLSFEHARAALAYEGPARTLVSAWKERGQHRLGDLFAGLVAEVVARPPVEVVTFVPGDRDRGLWRGQNPAETLARRVARAWELPVEPLLERRRAFLQQRGLTRAERRTNVRGAFHATSAPRSVALIDDVYTTGATAAAAASELRRAGARAVYVATFARAVRR